MEKIPTSTLEAQQNTEKSNLEKQSKNIEVKTKRKATEKPIKGRVSKISSHDASINREANVVLDTIKQQHAILKKIGGLTRAGKFEEKDNLLQQNDELNNSVEKATPEAIDIAIGQINKQREINDAIKLHRDKIIQSKKAKNDKLVEKVNNFVENATDVDKKYDRGIADLKQLRSNMEPLYEDKNARDYFKEKNYINREEEPDVPSSGLSRRTVTPPAPSSTTSFEVGLSSPDELKISLKEITDQKILETNLETRQVAYKDLLKMLENKAMPTSERTHLEQAAQEQLDAQDVIQERMRELRKEHDKNSSEKLLEDLKINISQEPPAPKETTPSQEAQNYFPENTTAQNVDALVSDNQLNDQIAGALQSRRNGSTDNIPANPTTLFKDRFSRFTTGIKNFFSRNRRRW